MTYAQFQQPPAAQYQYRPYVSARRRAQVAVVLLIVGAVVSFLTIPSHILDMYVSPLNSNEDIADNPGGFVALMFMGALGLATIVVYIATAVAFLMWLYRASNNVAAFGEHTQHSSGWAVGSFFVPIMCLFVPFQATKDIWQKSGPTTPGSFSFAVSPPGFFSVWWGFWIASNIASNVYLRMLADAPKEASAFVGIFSNLFSIAAAGFAIKVVRDIDRRQEERSRNLPEYAGPVPPPPPVFQAVPTAPIAGSSPAATTPLD